jgi:nicotinamide-nucleotide amidase
MPDSPLRDVQRASQILLAKELCVATAESCTGGGLAFWLTQLPGSSAWFDRGWITYSNHAKVDQLQVDANIINTDGAVSEACALAMAKGCLAQSRAQVSIAITGIAGPEGGSPSKPVGSVWIALAKHQHLVATLYHFTGTREMIREAAIIAALRALIDFL